MTDFDHAAWFGELPADPALDARIAQIQATRRRRTTTAHRGPVAAIPENTPEHQRRERLRQAGRKGGLATAKKYDMRARGRAGWNAYVNRHHDGDHVRAGMAFAYAGLRAQDPHPENGGWSGRQYPTRKD